MSERELALPGPSFPLLADTMGVPIPQDTAQSAQHSEQSHHRSCCVVLHISQ